MSDVLTAAIVAFDGTDFGALEMAVTSHFPSADDLAGLVVLVQVGDAHAQHGAAWALGRFLERGLPLLPAERRILLQCLDQDRAVELKLIICRAVPHLRTPPDKALAAATSLEHLLATGDREMRTAALDGLVALGARFPAIAERINAAVAAALGDPVPSIRAKARVLQRR